MLICLSFPINWGTGNNGKKKIDFSHQTNPCFLILEKKNKLSSFGALLFLYIECSGKDNEAWWWGEVWRGSEVWALYGSWKEASHNMSQMGMCVVDCPIHILL